MESNSLNTFKKGRGAQQNSPNRFLANGLEYDEAFFYGEENFEGLSKTKYLLEYPKNVVNDMNSPDLPNGKSVNPYQGCEHGCVYCYARNTHEYFGYSAGLDFEQKIIVKKNAAELLEKNFKKKTWIPTTIMLSGNTDCYQPAEKKFEITRKLLKICLQYQNPVSIITKNALVLRDLDILIPLAEMNLIHVILSITSLDENIRRKLEPRTVSGVKRLQVLEKLNKNGIPVGVMMAPIIPGLTDYEIPELIKRSAESGACWAGYTVVRLNGSVEVLFKDWVQKAFPDKAKKIINQIESLHGGNVNDSRVGIRMKGEGEYSDYISQLHRLARNKYMAENAFPPFDYSQFIRNGQMNLF